MSKQWCTNCNQTLPLPRACKGVCNAGVTRDNTFAALSPEDWDTVIDTSLDGFYNVVQPLIMPMVRARNGGRIVTLASNRGALERAGTSPEELHALLTGHGYMMRDLFTEELWLPDDSRPQFDVIAR